MNPLILERAQALAQEILAQNQADTTLAGICTGKVLVMEETEKPTIGEELTIQGLALVALWGCTQTSVISRVGDDQAKSAEMRQHIGGVVRVNIAALMGRPVQRVGPDGQIDIPKRLFGK